MKYTILIIGLGILTWTSCLGQDLVTIRDTVNHFEIGVPVGWRYGVPVNKSLAFMALSQKQNDQDVPRENFNINILHREEIDLEKSYGHFLQSVGKAEGFKILEQSAKVINGRKYRYLIETHKNDISKEDMSNCVLFTNNNGEILILTMVTTSERFEKFRSLFDSIALSLHY